MREDIGRREYTDVTVTAGGRRGSGVCVCVCSGTRLGRKNGSDSGGISNRGEWGGTKRRRFSVEPPERLYVRTLVRVRVRVYNTIKWRFLLNGRELRGRTGGGSSSRSGGCCGRITRGAEEQEEAR